MPRITRYWAHDPIGNSEGILAGYEPDALKAAPADEINVCLNTGSSPCILVPADGSDNFVYMVLPVRLRAGQ